MVPKLLPPPPPPREGKKQYDATLVKSSEQSVKSFSSYHPEINQAEEEKLQQTHRFF